MLSNISLSFVMLLFESQISFLQGVGPTEDENPVVGFNRMYRVYNEK